MGLCIRECDYLDYIEHRMGMRRRIRLMMHAFRCPDCRRDLMSWPALRRLIRHVERKGAGRMTGMSRNVMERIRCAR